MMKLLSLLLLLTSASTTTVVTAQDYIIVGVSGGLQDGFPDHDKMDYHAGQLLDEVQAVFLGRALVRGYKAYLDVMEETWRQYTPEPNQPLINCNVVPTGCWHHANEYWMYLIDTRQFIAILMNEPRFLSIAPDLGLVDLTAAETSAVVKHIANYEIQKQGKSDASSVAFPIVTGAWYNPTSHVPSPVLYTKEDGTQVTNFPQSLAKWAGVELEVVGEEEDATCGANSSDDDSDVEKYRQYERSDYWDKIRQAIRHSEANPLSSSVAHANGPPFDCEKKARFGVTPDMARINYAMSPEQVTTMLNAGGYVIDFEVANVRHGGE
jgi:hypothetical protein